MKKISAVIICKNEEVMLPRLLDSLRGIDEIIICDTGSSDKTVEIAKNYVPKVQFKEWEDNFAKARNYAKSFATGDWILSIDCDEFLHDVAKMREAVEIAEQKGAVSINVNMIAEDNTKQIFVFPRLFKNSPQVWWEGAIHNHVSVAGIDVGEVWITYGYSPAHQLDKERAFRILKKEVETTGNAREMFYLGREYFYRLDHENTVKILGQYVQKSKFLPEKAEAFLIMARAYWDMKMPDDARDALAQAIIINPDFKEALKFMGEISWQRQKGRWDSFADLANNQDVLFVRNI